LLAHPLHLSPIVHRRLRSNDLLLKGLVYVRLNHVYLALKLKRYVNTIALDATNLVLLVDDLHGKAYTLVFLKKPALAPHPERHMIIMAHSPATRICLFM